MKARHSPATRPINPSNASTSRTKVPFPLPRAPMDGLQDISPIVSSFCVNKRVPAPVRAAPAVGSQPPPVMQTILISHWVEYILS